VPDKKPLYAKYKSHRSGKSKSLGPVSVDICCLFDALLPIPMHVSYAKSNTSEFKLFPRLIKYIKETHIILIDNGFYSFKNFLAIRNKGAHFVVPLDTLARPQVIAQTSKDDYLCQIKNYKSKETMQVRIIYTYRKGFRRRRIATSLLDAKEYPAAELSDIYHLRWNIETFYREFKSTMNGNHWHCGKVESFKIEFLSKMILCCMTRLAVIKLGRIFSRDKQTYRKKSRALLRNKVGRPTKKRRILPSEESRAQIMIAGGLNKPFNILIA